VDWHVVNGVGEQFVDEGVFCKQHVDTGCEMDGLAWPYKLEDRRFMEHCGKRNLSYVDGREWMIFPPFLFTTLAFIAQCALGFGGFSQSALLTR
jgi:hypothetical protein